MQVAERIALHRIIRHEDKVRRTIMPGQIFTLSEEEARQLDARGVTQRPGRQAREPAVDISGVAERDEVTGEAAPVADKPTGKNGATTREKPAADEDEL
jgi:hypothetical protein